MECKALTDTQITEEVIQKNLRNVEEGKPLTESLAVLNGEFKRQYFKCEKCGKAISDGNITGFCGNCNYNQKPETKKRMKEYHKKYYQKNKEKLNARGRELYTLKKGKEEK